MRRVGVLATLLVAFVIVGVACPARCLAGAAPFPAPASPCHGHEDAPSADEASCCTGLIAVLGECGVREAGVVAAPAALLVVQPGLPATWAVGPPTRAAICLGSPPTPLYRRTCALLL